MAAANVFKSATAATEEVLAKQVRSSVPCSALPKPASIARAANRHQSRNRPKHPKSLDFELNTEHVPADFVRADIQHTGTRHLLFASAEQLELLSKAKTW